MMLLVLAGFVYSTIGMQCISKQDKNKAKCEVLDSTACGADTDCEYIGCTDAPNGTLCGQDATCYWTGSNCVDNTGCGAAPSKGKCNIHTDASDGHPCGFDKDAGECQRRTCAHSGSSNGWCLKFNGKQGPQCMFKGRKCWDLPTGEEAKTTAPMPSLSFKTKYCTSTRASKRVACSQKDEATCLADAADKCQWVDNTGTSPDTGSSTPGECDVSGIDEVKERKCNRKRGCQWESNACSAKTCDYFNKNQFTCAFKSAKINLSCVMDGATCRSGAFSDSDMRAKACSDSTFKRVCHAQVDGSNSPRCEWNADSGLCRDATNRTCGDANRQECRSLKSATPGEGCYWLGQSLRCLDKTTASCSILPEKRCKKVKKFKTHFGLTCALNRSNKTCYDNQVTCGDVTSGLFCVEHGNCSWNGTTCVNYADFPIAVDSSDTCQPFNKKTCKDWVNNCFWTVGANNGDGLCHVQPGATMP